ncbi:hypothetical protein COT95_01815, partial [Candidatus Falkowbacteria bacterium CG10_big_fil_rev_8_21_14_0_10_37_6]
MFKKKLLSFIMLSIMTFSLAGVVNAAGIKDILNSDELGEVSTDVYNNNAGGVPTRTVQGIVVLVINSIL